jgi:phosphoglycolate phosphatase
VVTAKPQVFAEKIVTHFHLAPYFQAIYGSQLDGTHAHKQDLIAHVLEELALPGTAAVMVGDRHHDIQGAKANGLATIGVLWGYGSQAELQGAGADCLCDRPADSPGLPPPSAEQLTELSRIPRIRSRGRCEHQP